MSGIEYISEDLSSHPSCPHGPTLLFSRSIDESGHRRNFFACSACRDRKICSFFLWADERERNSENKQFRKNVDKHKSLPKIDHRQIYLQLNEIQQKNAKLRSYCLTCNVWIQSNNTESHKDHEIKTGINDDNISFPSTFLAPLNNDRKEAQYLFTEKSVSTIINILQSLQIRNVLCIGAPRIHENILNNHPNMSSLLLDLDHRYHNFYGPLQFCWYNLFNHHFFLPESKDVFKDFLQTDKGKHFGIILDPPFGGRTEPIAQTLNKIKNLFNNLNSEEKLPIFLFFPYFMESQIQNSLDFKMVDYKVDYDNHVLFQDGVKGRKFGSPVRIFTNVNLSEIKLPETEGYRFCKKCEKFVYEENKHCKKCNACTSKDGRTYRHCNACSRCVKPTWIHCQKCERCAQPNHKCGDVVFSQKCFHCQERGHKKIDCPKVDRQLLKRKREKKTLIKKKLRK